MINPKRGSDIYPQCPQAIRVTFSVHKVWVSEYHTVPRPCKVKKCKKFDYTPYSLPPTFLHEGRRKTHKHHSQTKACEPSQNIMEAPPSPRQRQWGGGQGQELAVTKPRLRKRTSTAVGMSSHYFRQIWFVFIKLIIKTQFQKYFPQVFFHMGNKFPIRK